MDQADVDLLNLLQSDATLTAAALAARLGLDPAACADRIARLEASGTIAGRVALVDPRKVGLGVTVFVAIVVAEHSTEFLETFHRAVEQMPEVMEFFRMSGQVDYLLRVVVPDIDAYDRFYKKLIAVAKLKDVSSTFAMEQIKLTTRLPVAAGG